MGMYTDDEEILVVALMEWTLSAGRPALMDEHNFHSNLIRKRPTRFIFFAPLQAASPTHSLYP